VPSGVQPTEPLLRSALGPQPTGKPRTTVDRCGHRTLIEAAGRHAYSLLTSGRGRQAQWSSSLPPPPAGPGHRGRSLTSGRVGAITARCERRRTRPTMPPPAIGDVTSLDGGRDNAMTRGTVKWFNADKGYGFIAVDSEPGAVHGRPSSPSPAIRWTAVSSAPATWCSLLERPAEPPPGRAPFRRPRRSWSH
jgi:hypothetical protein